MTNDLAGSNRLAVLAAEIRHAHEGVQRYALMSNHHAYEAGKRLMEAKADEGIPRGGWERWVEDVAGVPHRTAAHYIQLYVAVSEGRATLPDIAKAGQNGVLRLLREAEAEARREASRSAPRLLDGMDYRVGDSRVMFPDIEPGTIPLMITDPPYESAAEPLWRWVGPWANEVLMPGGSFICYFGSIQTNKMYRILDDAGLQHWVTCWMEHDASQRVGGRFFIAAGKPILWYVKGYRRGRILVPNMVSDSVRDKSQHAWGQGDGGVRQWIHQLTEPGELILDPFAGTGRWGEIAVEMGRRWIGCDIKQGGTTTVVTDELDDVTDTAPVGFVDDDQRGGQ